jgi:uncharacterized protein YjiS (DUF1127 family)
MHTISPERFPGWRQVDEWHHQVRLHHELMDLPDRCLRDMGISCRTGDYRPSKSFWPL